MTDPACKRAFRLLAVASALRGERLVHGRARVPASARRCAGGVQGSRRGDGVRAAERDGRRKLVGALRRRRPQCAGGGGRREQPDDPRRRSARAAGAGVDRGGEIEVLPIADRGRNQSERRHRGGLGARSLGSHPTQRRSEHGRRRIHGRRTRGGKTVAAGAARAELLPAARAGCGDSPAAGQRRALRALAAAHAQPVRRRRGLPRRRRPGRSAAQLDAGPGARGHGDAGAARARDRRADRQGPGRFLHRAVAAGREDSRGAAGVALRAAGTAPRHRRRGAQDGGGQRADRCRRSPLLPVGRPLRRRRLRQPRFRGRRGHGLDAVRRRSAAARRARRRPRATTRPSRTTGRRSWPRSGKWRTTWPRCASSRRKPRCRRRRCGPRASR